MLVHNRVHLALHHLRPASPAGGRPLLLLHGLGEASPDDVPAWAAAWPGPVHALDFTGHGASNEIQTKHSFSIHFQGRVLPWQWLADDFIVFRVF